jgi:REP element-mobilizing transposase RayT
MPHRPRIHLGGVPLQILRRGYNREPCFGEKDYSSYLHWLGETLGEADCAPHAYVLMTNHVHLLLTAKKGAAVLDRRQMMRLEGAGVCCDWAAAGMRRERQKANSFGAGNSEAGPNKAVAACEIEFSGWTPEG